MKLVLVTRLELAKTVAYKVGKTEEDIIAFMRDERTLHAEEAIGLQLAHRFEEKLLQGGDEIINI
ncbi:hypothetical protein OS242_18290 [Tumebacillus sp. DT12]|uniref:Uncharacterized protein n=1 Tax=Tumebacillus lacus TaxID=2995335 RepID=A0ABT3X8B5_9BACL|nr:hypothetical protein [Tumebacillus lacus]MCX7571896.1 hypothetical protein [Tumebacillus lacus]